MRKLLSGIDLYVDALSAVGEALTAGVIWCLDRLVGILRGSTIVALVIAGIVWLEVLVLHYTPLRDVTSVYRVPRQLDFLFLLGSLGMSAMVVFSLGSAKKKKKKK